jgi:translocation and assembly module TamA
LPESRYLPRGLLVLAVLLLARAAVAAEVTIQLPRGAQGLAGKLRDAALSVETAARADAGPQDMLAAARADYGRLAAALYAAGRYGAVISIRVDGREAADISPLSEPARIDRVVIGVRPGPVFTFSRASVAPLAPGTDLPGGYRRGAPALSGRVKRAAEAGAERWRALGHAKVEIAEQRVTADHRAARLSSEIVLNPGPRLSFGRLRIAGESGVRPGRVRAIAGLPTGRVYSPAELERASRRLRRTGAFSSVVLRDADEVSPGDRLDITATLTDAKPRRFGFGAELSSLEGLAFSGFWLHRNLLGGAERLRIAGEVGGIGGDSGGTDITLSARFERPATFTPDTDLFVEARAQDLDEPDFRERILRVGGGLSHIFSDTLTAEAGLAYRYADIDDDLGARTLEHVLFPARLTYDTRDDPIDATRGNFYEVEATPFAGLGTGNAGARLFLDARTYSALGAGDGLVFATRAQFGTVAGAGVTDVSPDMLFFSGGAGTVRGHAYHSLGVPLGGGRTVGGRSLAAVSAELRAHVKDDWSVVGFADAGFVGRDSWWDPDGGDSHAGAGIGLRYDTGLGPVRVDLATPIDDDAGNGLELYIGIGQAF